MARLKKKVAVAMSGGVDSSVAAALLQQQGYTVIGFFAKTWTPQPNDGTFCTWVEERRDALRVAAQLNIPLITVDLEKEYRQGVVNELFEGYARGQTPNPDVLCNRIVKFDALWHAAQKFGADYFATGHYARIENGQILRGVDEQKDQSYFLWAINARVLPQILFPIGGYTKPEVRQLAKKFGLPVATKKDSQGICFLGPTDLKTFLGTRLPEKPGPIIDKATGKIVGTHMGAHFYTLGQRHGFGDVSTKGARHYIVAIDTKKNALVLGSQADLMHRTLTLRECNWLDNSASMRLQEKGSLSVLAQVRYRQSAQPATLSYDQGQLRMTFAEPVFAPTPGQSVVFYTLSSLLGGAIIDECLH